VLVNQASAVFIHDDIHHLENDAVDLCCQAGPNWRDYRDGRVGADCRVDDQMATASERKTPPRRRTGS